MKVKIGRYKTGVRVSSIITYWERKLELSENISDKLHDFAYRTKFKYVTVAIDKLLNLFNFSKHRTIKVRIDNFDCWDAYTTMAYIIYPLLNKLKVNKHGAPEVDNDDVPEEIRTENKSIYSTDDNTFKRWDYVLDEMIWAFGQIISDWEAKFHLDQFDKEGYEKHQARIYNGLRLFGKYYMSLWD